MKLKYWLTNRVLLGMIAFFVLVGLWEFRWKPQYRPVYLQGVTHYQRGSYGQASAEFKRAYKISPNSLDVILMMGWTEMKLRHYEESRFYFARALRIDPRTWEARLGLNFISLETGKGRINRGEVEAILRQHPDDPNARILLAAELVHEGKNEDAVAIYRSLINDPGYGRAARVALEELTGVASPVGISFALAPTLRAPELSVPFRAAGTGFLQKQGNSWQPFYVNGIDLGPGAPGYFPGAPPLANSVYAAWVADVLKANANVIRAYTLLPPAFYEAFDKAITSGGKLSLFQQIWIGDPPRGNLYDRDFVAQSQAEIRYVVDAVHGRGDVPPKYARGSGLYMNDISEHVAAILLGREMEPSVVQTTNQLNPGETGYKGKYVSIQGGSATETWFAQMLDYLIGYETETYNSQHPVAMVNWPPLDPLHHPTESSVAEEVRWRNQKGEKLAGPSKPLDDNDVVAIDEAKFRQDSGFQAGLFASYHVYPYYPDFLLLDPKYLSVRDGQGLNPMYGYLRDLHAHIPYPLVITEFGIPSSIGISHFHPYGWHHGGQTEVQQAADLVRMARAIREAGCAGGIVFELMDEWYKQNWLTAPFEIPAERTPLWINEMDPEKRYGLIGFRTSKWRLFAGDDAAWSREQTIYKAEKSSPPAGDLLFLQSAADEAFLYLRLHLACPDCAAGVGGRILDQNAYALAINTLPGSAGIRQLPFGNLTLDPGANFLLYLAAPNYGRLFVADDYNPYQLLRQAAAPDQSELVLRSNYRAELRASGQFVDMVVETNRARYGREGAYYPAQRYSRSILRYGSGNPGDSAYDSLAEWFFDPAKADILVRIPWGKLLVTDPSNRQIWVGFDHGRPQTARTTGVQVSAFVLRRSGPPAQFAATTLLASFPSAVNGAIQSPSQFTWPGWDSVKAQPYFKKAYYAIQKDFQPTSRESSQRHGGPADLPAGARELGRGFVAQH
jgi:hypothetical protein